MSLRKRPRVAEETSGGSIGKTSSLALGAHEVCPYVYACALNLYTMHGIYDLVIYCEVKISLDSPGAI